MASPHSPFSQSLVHTLESWNKARMASFDNHDMANYLEPAGKDIDVEVISELNLGNPKILAKLTGLAKYKEIFAGFDEEIKSRNVLGKHVMLPCLDTSTSCEEVQLSVPWHFYEQHKMKEAPLMWKSSGYSQLVWKKREIANLGETDPKKIWCIAEYRVILLANSDDNVTGGLDYETM